MNTVSRTYQSKSSAKRSLHKVFGVGPYSNNGLYASAKFCNGNVESENGEFVLYLKSTYWTEHSLKKAFSVGIDNI